MTSFFRTIIDYIIGKITWVDKNKLKVKMDIKEKESKVFRGIKGTKSKAETVVQIMNSFRI
ncbi:MAG: hypothetical protein ACTSRR_05890 [Candidatus Heimdallarchaeaceae archaeon]